MIAPTAAWTTAPVRVIAWTPPRVSNAIALFTGGGEPVANLAGNTGGTEAIAFDPHGELLAAGGQDRVIRVYRTGDLAQIAELPGPTGDIRPAGAASAITPPQDHATGSASPPVR